MGLVGGKENIEYNHPYQLKHAGESCIQGNKATWFVSLSAHLNSASAVLNFHHKVAPKHQKYNIRC